MSVTLRIGVSNARPRACQPLCCGRCADRPDDGLTIRTEGRSRPGELAEIAQKVADHRINIEYAYTATPPGASKGVMILRVNNLKKASRVLRGH